MVNGKSNRILLFYAYIASLWGSLYAYMSFFTPYSKKLGASDLLAGLIVGGYGLTQMLLRVPLGVLSDKIRRRKPFACAGMAAALLAAVGMYFFPTPVGLLVFRAFGGIAASTWVTSTVLFSSYFSAEDAPKAMTRLQGANMIGNTLAGLIGARIAQARGEPSAFLFAIALGSTGLVISLFLRENRPEQTRALSMKEVVRIGGTPALLSVAIIGILLQTITLGTSGSFTQEWATEIGVTTGQLGYLSLFANVPGILSSLFLSRLLLKRFQPRTLILIGSTCMAAALCVIPFCRNMASLFTAQAFQGLGSGLIMPMLLSLALLSVDVERRGVAMGFYQSIYAFGMFAGPVISGTIKSNASLPILFWTMAGIAVLMAAISAYALKRREPLEIKEGEKR